MIVRPAHGSRDCEGKKTDTLGVPRGLSVSEINRRAKRLQGTFVGVFSVLESSEQLPSALGNHFFEVLSVIRDLALKPLLVQRIVDAGHDGAFVERFNQVVISAAPHS